MNDEMNYWEMFNFTLGSLRLNDSKQKEKWDIDTSTSARRSFTTSLTNTTK